MADQIWGSTVGPTGPTGPTGGTGPTGPTGATGTVIGGAPTQMRYGRVTVACDGTLNGKSFNYSSAFPTATDVVVAVQSFYGTTTSALTIFTFNTAAGFTIAPTSAWPASPATITYDYIAFGH